MIKTKLIVFLILTFSFILSASAGSATWNLDATNGDWYTADNWTPPTVPNGPLDTATFCNSESSRVHLPAFTATTLDGLVYDAAAREFTTSIEHDASLVFVGSGVTNNSRHTHEFIIQGGIGAGANRITFLNDAKSGINVFYTLLDGNPVAAMTFSNNSVSEGLPVLRGGQVEFFDTASDPSGVLCFGAATADGAPGVAIFHDHSVIPGTVNAYEGADNGPPGRPTSMTTPFATMVFCTLKVES